MSPLRRLRDLGMSVHLPGPQAGLFRQVLVWMISRCCGVIRGTRGIDQCTDPSRGIVLHARHEVAVTIECDLDARVAEALLYDLRVNAHRERYRSVGVPQ